MNAARGDVAAVLPRSLEGTEKLPRSVYVAVAGLACLPVGLLWDISHHSTIGRDTFWTPAHILIQLGGIVPALLFASIALKMTLRGTREERDSSVSFWGLRAPLGVWVTIWGAMAMMTSAPFDDWWHNRYGLDVKIVSPPHAVLGLGMFAVGMGVLLFVFSAQNRAKRENRTRSGLVCALAVGALIALWADFGTEFTWPNLQHASYFYRVACTPFPLLLVLAARASKVRAGATIAAATYMLIYLGMILVLPLFPAHPKLAPIYQPMDHMVPPAFPLLLIAPAVAIDVIGGVFAHASRTARQQQPPVGKPVLRPRWCWKASTPLIPRNGNMIPPLTPPRRGTDRARTNACSPPGRGRGWVGSWKALFRFLACIGTLNLSGSRHQYGVPPSGGPDRLKPELQTGGWWKDWLLAVVFAAVFLGIIFAVQWPFSAFLLSDAADNRFFARSGHWPYFAPPGDWMNSFWDLNEDPITLQGIALAFARAFLSARIGLWLGNYLLRLKR